MSKSFFISDLHLFSKRSSAMAWLPKFQQAVEQSHTFILGGDIFDFRWSLKQSLGHAIDDSIDWLRQLMQCNPACSFHYLLGNHDCHPEFVEALDGLTKEVGNLAWHRHVLRIENCVFLHGDIVDAKIRHGENFDSVLDAKRLAGELRDPPTAFSHALYDAAIRARVHRLVVQLSKPNDMILRRLVQYLESHHLTVESGIERVYFGHTHRRILSVPFQGIKFSNPGATIKGLPFSLVETEAPLRPISQWKK